MKRKLFFLIFILLALAAASLFLIARLHLREARPLDPEFTKLTALIDKYKTADLLVVAEGLQSEPMTFLALAKDYLFRHYESGDDAVGWVKENCCRTREGNTLYFKYPDGSTRLMRDVFLEELKAATEGSGEEASGKSN